MWLTSQIPSIQKLVVKPSPPQKPLSESSHMLTNPKIYSSDLRITVRFIYLKSGLFLCVCMHTHVCTLKHDYTAKHVKKLSATPEGVEEVHSRSLMLLKCSQFPF